MSWVRRMRFASYDGRKALASGMTYAPWRSLIASAAPGSMTNGRRLTDCSRVVSSRWAASAKMRLPLLSPIGCAQDVPRRDDLEGVVPATATAGSVIRPPRLTAAERPRPVRPPRASRTTPELAQDARRRAPDRQPVDGIGAERSGQSRTVRSTISIGASGRNRCDRRRRRSGRPRPATRPATAPGGDGDDRGHREVADRDPEPFEAARRPGRRRRSASRATSSAASRRAVAARSASSGSALPPGKLTSPL